MTTRCIRLRRPAQLAIQKGPFVPDAPVSGLLDEVERRWQALREDNPAYYDGRLYHVTSVHRNGYGGATVHVVDCAYRFHAVQDAEFDLGVRPLGVKGIVMRDGRVLLGRRSMTVGAYRGLWEFAPAGVVDPGHDPAEVLQRELKEETGLTCRQEPTPIALLYDPVLRCWELAFRLETTGEIHLESGEYSDTMWRTPNDLPTDLTPIARQMITLLLPAASP